MYDPKKNIECYVLQVIINAQRQQNITCDIVIINIFKYFFLYKLNFLF